MLKGRSLHIITFLLAVLIGLFCSIPALAGDGDGSGGGQGNPLTLVSAVPADGQKDVSLSPEMTLTFSKNVVNMSVKNINQNCFVLTSVSGTKIPVKVTMADDQVEPEKKQTIVVSPAVKLSPGTQFVLKVLPELTSKSGDTLGQQVTVSFYTKKDTAATDTTGSSPVPGTVKTDTANSSAAAVKNSATAVKDSATTGDKASQKNTKNTVDSGSASDAKSGEAGSTNNANAQTPAASVNTPPAQTGPNVSNLALIGSLIVMIIASTWTYFRMKRR